MLRLKGRSKLINLEAVWNRVLSEFRGDRSSIHGPAHWKRVEANGLEIAASNHASAVVVRLFAVLHDSQRIEDANEVTHGQLAAQYAASMRGKLFDLDDRSFQQLQYACRWHTHGRVSSDPTIGACRDADRLDLVRIGITPDPNLMSTIPGKQMASSIGKLGIEKGAEDLLQAVREQLLLYSNSMNRMNKLLDFCPLLEPYGLEKKRIRHAQWLRLLGENWVACDVITPYRRILRSVLGDSGPIREMMNARENAAYNMLPDIVTVYRGCDVAGKGGLCWSLDEEVANAFPFQTRFKADHPILIRARAKKNRILAVKLDRNETEIIVFSPRVSKIKDGDEAAARRLFELRWAQQNARLDSLANLTPISSYTIT